jgi:hypothetical protein
MFGKKNRGAGKPFAGGCVGNIPADGYGWLRKRMKENCNAEKSNEDEFYMVF